MVGSNNNLYPGLTEGNVYDVPKGRGVMAKGL